MMTKLPVNGILVKVNAKSTINKNENSDFARYYYTKLTRKIKYLPVIFLLCSLYAKLIFWHLCTSSINTVAFVRLVQTLQLPQKMFLLPFEVSLPDLQAVLTPGMGISARSGKYLRHRMASLMAPHLLI